MAVLKTVVTDRGLEFSDQYCRVEEIRASKSRMVYTIGIHLNQVSAQNGLPPHRAEDFSCSFSPVAELNPWQQAYADLKERWPDAVDA